MSTQVVADLHVQDGAATRTLNVEDFTAGVASEATLAGALAALGDILTQLQGVLSVVGTVTATLTNADYPLPAAQVASLTPPALPATYPLPSAQVTTLTPPTSVTVLNPTANPETGLAKALDVQAVRDRLPVLVGEWGYDAGAAGTVIVAAGRRVIGIAAHSTAGGSLTINGGASVPIPAGSGIAIAPVGNLVAPTIVFTGTDSHFVETVGA